MSNISYPKYKLPNNLNVNSVTASNGFEGDLYGTASYSSDADKLDGLDSSEYALKTDVTGALEPYALSSDVSSSFVSYTEATASLARLSANNTYTGINTFNNSITGSNLLLTNDLKVNGTASINLLNTIESNHLKVGDKYITILSGANTQAILDGSGILFGSGSGETPVNDQNSVASILYRNDVTDGKIEIFPGLRVTGSIEVTGGITGSFKGDGSQLINIPASAVDLSNYARKDLSNIFTAKQTISSSLQIGSGTVAAGLYSVVEGRETSATSNYSHAEGAYTLASGLYSHAEGGYTTASNSYSHAEGASTKATGFTSHAEGNTTTAAGDNSHSEGSLTIAAGFGSHAEGRETVASGSSSHAEGHQTRAVSDYSHTEGLQTTSSADYQHVEGKWNALKSSAISIIGNGTSNIARSNILEVYQSNITISGSLNVSSSISAFSYTGSLFGTASFSQDSAKLGNVTSSLYALKTDVTGAIANFATRAEVTGALSTYLTGVATDVNITGSGTISDPVILKDDISLNSVTASNGIKIDGVLLNGDSVTVSGLFSHAEGNSTNAEGDYSHAEGWSTWAVGVNSHAEGAGSRAEGASSHAEGYICIAYGEGSHAEGFETIASASGQHTQGKYNATSSTALVLIGNGTSDLARSNILEVYTGSVNILGQSVLDGGQVVKVSSKTSNYVLTASSDYILTFSGSNLTGTLPSASLCNGSTFIIKNKHGTPLYITSSGGNIDGNGAVTINTQYYSYTLVSDGTDWNII